MGKIAEADRLFEQLIREYPQSRFRADVTYRLAQQAFDARDYDRARDRIDGLLAQRTSDRIREYALYLRGQIAVAQTDWPKAQEAFETLIREFPGSRLRMTVEYWLAEVDYRRGNLAAADKRLEQLAEQGKNQPDSWVAMVLLRRAQILVKRQQWSDAYAIAERLRKDFPNFNRRYEVDYLLGRCLANQADFEGARRAYDQVILSASVVNPEAAAMAQWMIGETYFHQKDYRAALHEYLRLEAHDAYPEWQAAALLEAGKCYQRLGETANAAELYRRILQKYPKTSSAPQAAKLLQTVAGRTP